jgi:MFS transporter, AAHS family, 4-hydroxybenzoate transporter
MDQRLDVQRFLDEQPFSAYQRLIFALTFAIVLLDGFDTAAIGFVAPSLMKEWGIGKPDLAPVLSAALFGLAAGALVAGPLADRIGRKLVLTTSVLLFGASSLGCAWANDLSQLATMRAVTGIGLGAALPNAVTLMNEYCPTARRATLTNAMLCGFPVGAALGGFLASWLIPAFGFRSVFVFGGVAPLLLGILLVALLPESVRYLLSRRGTNARVGEILVRVAPASRANSGATWVAAQPPAGAKSGAGLLVTNAYWVGTLMLWIAYFMGLVIFYALINWLPVLLRESGLAAQQATLVSALFPLGGVGAVFAGLLMDRKNPNRIVALFFALTALALFLLGRTGGNVGLLMFVVLVAGVVMNTAQSSLPALAAAFYPTEGRATGVAWMMGIGRFGGIFGSFLVGELTRRQLSLEQIFTVMAAPGLIAAIALMVKRAVELGKESRQATLLNDVPNL